MFGWKVDLKTDIPEVMPFCKMAFLTIVIYSVDPPSASWMYHTLKHC